MIRRTVLACAFLIGLLAAGGGAEAQSVAFPRGEATIDTKSGPRQFAVEVATTEDQRERGLMFRPMLAADAGMLFLFPEPQQVTFWMKNTLIPLDMVFIRADGHVESIHARAVPMSEAHIRSEGPVVAVLELNGGTADRVGISPGDLVNAPGLGGAPVPAQ